jgi:hypothetical protein
MSHGNAIKVLQFRRASDAISPSPKTSDAAQRVALGQSALKEWLEGNYHDRMEHSEKLRQQKER